MKTPPNHCLLLGRRIAALMLVLGINQSSHAASWVTNTSMNVPRVEYTAVLLPNGKLLVAGNAGLSSAFDAELYDPAGGTWASAGPMLTVRHLHTATLLRSGQVLV